jgi:hypothetical protein
MQEIERAAVSARKQKVASEKQRAKEALKVRGMESCRARHRARGVKMRRKRKMSSKE